MIYRIDDLEVPSEEPFRHDSLEREPLVGFLSSLIGRLDGPFVMALDSPFGSGKTTLVRMLLETLKNKGHPCIYFNAWEVDYATDPLVALVSSIDRIDLGTEQETEEYQKHLASIKKVTTLLAKQVVIAGVKGLTSGLVNLEEITKAIKAINSEETTDTNRDIVEEFNQERDLLEKFREELEKAVKLLPTVGDKPSKLVFFIDELDRCRPTFAIQLLERIKHLFDAPNIIFVLSIDKKQIEASIKAVYGAEFDATEYLRRFFDLEYGIPVVNIQSHIEKLITRFDLDPVFEGRSNNPATADDRKQFVEFFTLISEAMGLTLRAQERCITRLQVIIDQTPPDHSLDPVLVALLIVLRSNQPDLYNRFIRGESSPDDVMEFLTNLPGWKIAQTDRSTEIMHAHLLVTDPDRGRSDQRIKEVGSAAQAGNDKYASSVVNRMGYVQGHLRYDRSLAEIAKKIDLASGVRE